MNEIAIYMGILDGKEIEMGFDKNWRPPDWEQIKANMLNEIPINFSPGSGYSKEDKFLIMERTASTILGALAEVIVTDSKE